MKRTEQLGQQMDRPLTAPTLILAAVSPAYTQPCAWEELPETYFGPIVRIRSLIPFSDGPRQVLVAGGGFSESSGAPGNQIASWDGSMWSALGRGLGSGVYSQEVFDDGTGPTLYAGGHFARAGDIADANGIARWDGSEWEALGTGLYNEDPGHSHNGAAMAVFDDGAGPALYVGGHFTHAGGVPAINVARWDGEQWSAMGEGILGTPGVRAMAVFDDGSGPALYAGGYTVGGVLRWNGDSWEPLGAGNVEAMAVFDDGSGQALYVGSQGGGGLRKWNGQQWSVVGGGTDFTVQALHVFDDVSGPALYVGGAFVRAGGKEVWGIAKWDGSMWHELDGGVYDDRGFVVDAMTTFDDGSGPALYVAGKFSRAGGIDGIPVQNVARWRCAGAGCYADCDRDGELTFFDFLCFQSLFAAMDPGADCDGDGEFTFFDFLCFQNAFAGGCS